MIIKDGKNFMENVVMQFRSNCTHCGKSFSFLEAGLAARNQGIKDSVVMCPNCSSVFTIDMNISGMQLMQDVTANYGVRGKRNAKNRRWWQFWK